MFEFEEMLLQHFRFGSVGTEWLDLLPSDMHSLPADGATEHVWLVVGGPAMDARFAMVGHQGVLGL